MRAFLTATLLAGVFAASQAAAAPVVTVTNQLSVQGWQGTSPNSSYPWQHNLGVNFDTSRLTFELLSDRSMAVNMYTTLPPGGASGARMADMFFDTSSPASPGGFTFAVSLGQQSANGGVSAGVYAISGSYAATTPGTNPTFANYKTSENIWASKSGQTYGGQFGFANNPGTLLTPAVVVTGGNTVKAANGSNAFTVSALTSTIVGTSREGPTGPVSSGGTVVNVYDYSFTITANDAATFASFFNYFDVFWGTADCANGPIWGTVSVPEPTTMALLMTGLLGFAVSRRRRVTQDVAA